MIYTLTSQDMNDLGRNNHVLDADNISDAEVEAIEVLDEYGCEPTGVIWGYDSADAMENNRISGSLNI
jgi:hypothetical protein